MAAGSVGVFVFRDVLGSSFLARALHLRLRPFDREGIEPLVRPFDERGAPLALGVLDALFLATGGIPALLTYGLQQLWQLDSAADHDVTTIYARFREEHSEYVKDLLGALKDPLLSEAPQRVWESIQRKSGRIDRSELEKAVGPPSGALNLDIDDVLHLLEAVGAVRLESSAIRDDPVTVYPVTSLLQLPGASSSLTDLREHFLRDLRTLLEKLHRFQALDPVHRPIRCIVPRRTPPGGDGLIGTFHKHLQCPAQPIPRQQFCHGSLRPTAQPAMVP